ncbi:MAG: type II secretion system protein GspG [Fimbriimonas sp.]|nr:type II secretion system protein GspG [Fimbriimonas sp.]
MIELPQTIQIRTRGFVVTVVAGAILLSGFAAAYFMPTILGGRSSRQAKTLSDLATLSNAIDQFRVDCGRYPHQREGLQALYVKPAGIQGWSGPYLNMRLLRDDWGYAYRYRCPGPAGKGFAVTSYGADGAPGGTGERADLTVGSDE